MIRLLEAREINQVLADNFSIWAPGMDRSGYRHYQWWQLDNTWGRRHLAYFGIVSDTGEVLASCKRYTFTYASRGKTFKIAGVGAVFVDERNRGHSYGVKMLEDLATLSKDEGYDALILNSDIAPEYYERLGFYLFDSMSFSARVNQNWLRSSIKAIDERCDKDLDESFNIRSLKSEDIGEMIRHHRRWLRRQPYGLLRTEEYWNFKLGRELYLFRHSRLNWPTLNIITDNFSKYNGGYALIEQAGEFLRVLEVIGTESIRSSLWSQILRLAERRNMRTIRGWEIMAPELKDLEIHERDWSFPMICPLREDISEELISWTDVDPAIILELDHF